jgi:hypothetical protein
VLLPASHACLFPFSLQEEYEDLNTLELRLQQVVHHIVRKPPGSSTRTTSQGGDPGLGDSFVQQLMGGGGGEAGGAPAGDAAPSPSSQGRQQAQQQQQQQQQQSNPQLAQQAAQHRARQLALQEQLQQQQPAAGLGGAPDAAAGQTPAALNAAAGAAGITPAGQGQVFWVDDKFGQQDRVLAPGGGNQLAVAGAPAGRSTAESVQRGGTGTSGGGAIDFTSLVAAGGGDVTSAVTLPSGVPQQPTAAAAVGQQPGGVLDAPAGLAGGLTAAQLPPTYMSNGAPVLLRGAGAGASSTAPAAFASTLMPTSNGMVSLGGGGGGGVGMMPTSQQQPLHAAMGNFVPSTQLKLEPAGGGGGGLVPQMQIKMEGGAGGNMAMLGGGSAGAMLGLHQQQHQQQQQQQQHMMMQQQIALQQQGGLIGGGMPGAVGQSMYAVPNGYGEASLLPARLLSCCPAKRAECLLLP